jgi:hypothetical protein
MIEQAQAGASAARNHGAKQAIGELLIFLDDDIEPTPDFIRAHVNAHQGVSDLIVIGYSPPLREQNTFFSLELQGWWEAMFRHMRQPGHRFLYSDMLSGNFSISRDVFHQVGGFDLRFLVHEDYEFGVRLIRAGIAFVFEPAALGIHHEKTDIMRPLYRKYDEGIADVLLGKMYPELVPYFLITRLFKYSLIPSRIMRFLTFKSPKVAEHIASVILMALPILEKARMLGMWRKALDGLLGYWYWKGVSQKLTSMKEVQDFVSQNSHETSGQENKEIILDLSDGLNHAEQILDEARPGAARIYFGKTLIGHMHSETGAEQLRGVHLRPFLVNQLSSFVYHGLASQTVFQPPLSIEEIIAYSNQKISSSIPME